MRWAAPLAALAALRAAIPLAALAASGHKLPGLPRYENEGLSGDATGFYATAREFISSVPQVGKALLAVLVLAWIALAVVLVRLVRRRRLEPHWALAAGALALLLIVTLVITRMTPSGGAVFGWPLLWSIPMAPLRALGVLDADAAFAVGLPLALAANAVTVFATAYVGLYATGKRWVGLGAAAAFTVWPLLTGVIAGQRGWENGTWTVDVGLAMYTEPISTMLVTAALALLLAPARGPVGVTAGGLAFGLATLVKLSNGLLAVIGLLALLWRDGARRSLPFAVGALSFAGPVIAYWPKGYVPVFDNPKSFPPTAFSFDFVVRNWVDSLLFSPRTLAVLVPLAVVGAFALRSRYEVLLVVVPVLVNAAFYSFFANTIQHPRFLFVSLPAVFVLWIAGAGTLLLGARKALRGRTKRASMMAR